MYTTKHLHLIESLAKDTNIFDLADRVTLERKYPPFLRTYFALHTSIDRETLRAIEAIADAHGLDCNPFRSGGQLTSITFVDADEHRNSR